MATKTRNKLISKAGKETGKVVAKGKKIIDDLFTPKKIKEKEQKVKKTQAASDRSGKAEEKFQPFTGEQLKAKRLAKNKRQKANLKKEKDAAISSRKDVAKAVAAGSVPVIAGGVYAASKSGDDKSRSKTMETTRQMKKDAKDVSAIADFSSKGRKDIPPHPHPHARGESEIDVKKPEIPKRPKVTGKGGRNVSTGAKETGKRTLANVTAEQLKNAGLTGGPKGLRKYLNFMDKNGRRPTAKDFDKAVNKNMGGMMRSKMASKGGKMGGKMARGMKAGGMAKKGYSKGGAVKSSKKRSSGAALRGFGAEIK